MIDVIFLLLVFFIYAMVLMVRVDLVPMELHTFETGQPAEPAPAATISIDLEGKVFFDRSPVDVEALANLVLERMKADPSTVVYLAVAEGHSDIDRAPVLQDVWDRLRPAGVTINLVGRPRDSGRPSLEALEPPITPTGIGSSP